MNRILDFHAHVGKDKDGIEFTLDQLIDSMVRDDITHSVVFPLDEREKPVEEASMDLKEKVRDIQLYPLFRFDPKDMTPERLSLRLQDFYGVKLHPRAQDFDPLDEKYFPLYEVIEKSGKPLLLHTRYQCLHDEPGTTHPNMNPDRIVGLADYFQNLKLVMAHFANGSAYVQKAMQTHPNVYLETSILGSSPVTIDFAVNAIGSNRILFGSDVPYSTQRIERLKIEESGLNSVAKEKILYHNAAELLGV